MIARLRGEVVEKEPGRVVLDVAGVGYLVSVGPAMGARLGVGERTVLSISTQVREDSFTLFGFESAGDRRLFEQLLGVSGVGPKMGLAILDTMGAAGLARAIQEEDVRALCGVSGVGKKTAQRLLLELRGKITAYFQPGVVAAARSATPEDPLRLALARLGYKRSEIDRALAGIAAAGADESDLASRLSAALRVLSGGRL